MGTSCHKRNTKQVVSEKHGGKTVVISSVYINSIIHVPCGLVMGPFKNISLYILFTKVLCYTIKCYYLRENGRYSRIKHLMSYTKCNEKNLKFTTHIKLFISQGNDAKLCS